MIQTNGSHSRRIRKWVEQLRSQRPERRCTWVYAVLLAESQFRPISMRVFEYVAWFVLSYLAPSRAVRLSVGVAQVQIRHWVRFGIMSSTRPSPRNLLTALSISANYDIVHAYLAAHIGSEPCTARRIASCYVGEARSYHVAVLESAYRTARVELSRAQLEH
jgi:hypothetical protein